MTKCNTRGKVLHDYSLHPLDHRGARNADDHAYARLLATSYRPSSWALAQEVRRQLQPERYDASAAGARARALRHVPRRSKILAPDSELFQVIHSMLAKGWSPQQIAARLKDYWPDNPERHVSHETIYLTIYAYPRGELKRQLIGYLRQLGASAIRLNKISATGLKKSKADKCQATGKAT